MNDVTVAPTRHKLTVDDYYRMGDAGILGEIDRVELIDGELIDMAPIGQDHAATVDALCETLVLACQGRAIVRVQSSVHVDPFSEPQPDFAVLRRRSDFYRTGERPGPAHTLLLVEVADSSLRFDSTVKLGVYARAGIPEYWIVDLKKRVLRAYRQPDDEGYGESTTHRPGERLALSQAPEIVVGLDLVFG